MEMVLRGMVVYVVVWVLTRLSGRRALGEMTSFDFVLLLIISECTQQALIGKDYSLTGVTLAAGTLVGLDIGLSLLKMRFALVEKIVDDVAVLLVEEGEVRRDRLRWARVDEDDILEAARSSHGLERMEQVKYAILEKTGGISIVPWPDEGLAR